MNITQGSGAPERWFREGCFISEWSNGPHDEALSVARARVPVGGTTRWHALDGIVERYVILSGEGRAEVGDAAPVVLAAGDVLVIPAGAPQRITNTGGADLVFLALCTPRFRLEAYREIDRD